MPANQSNALEDSPMEDSAGESAESDIPGVKKQSDPAKRLTRIVLAAVAVLFGCHMAADRYTPYTNLGKVDGFIVPIVPQVSGYLPEVNVRLHDVVTERRRRASAWPRHSSFLSLRSPAPPA